MEIGDEAPCQIVLKEIYVASNGRLCRGCGETCLPYIEVRAVRGNNPARLLLSLCDQCATGLARQGTKWMDAVINQRKKLAKLSR